MLLLRKSKYERYVLYLIESTNKLLQTSNSRPCGGVCTTALGGSSCLRIPRAGLPRPPLMDGPAELASRDTRRVFLCSLLSGAYRDGGEDVATTMVAARGSPHRDAQEPAPGLARNVRTLRKSARGVPRSAGTLALREQLRGGASPAVRRAPAQPHTPRALGQKRTIHCKHLSRRALSCLSRIRICTSLVYALLGDDSKRQTCESRLKLPRPFAQWCV